MLNVASADWFLSDAFPFRLFVTSPRICLGLDTIMLLNRLQILGIFLGGIQVATMMRRIWKKRPMYSTATVNKYPK